MLNYEIKKSTQTDALIIKNGLQRVVFTKYGKISFWEKNLITNKWDFKNKIERWY